MPAVALAGSCFPSVLSYSRRWPTGRRTGAAGGRRGWSAAVAPGRSYPRSPRARRGRTQPASVTASSRSRSSSRMLGGEGDAPAPPPLAVGVGMLTAILLSGSHSSSSSSTPSTAAQAAEEVRSLARPGGRRFPSTFGHRLSTSGARRWRRRCNLLTCCCLYTCYNGVIVRDGQCMAGGPGQHPRTEGCVGYSHRVARHRVAGGEPVLLMLCLHDKGIQIALFSLTEPYIAAPTFGDDGGGDGGVVPVAGKGGEGPPRAVAEEETMQMRSTPVAEDGTRMKTCCVPLLSCCLPAAARRSCPAACRRRHAARCLPLHSRRRG